MGDICYLYLGSVRRGLISVIEKHTVLTGQAGQASGRAALELLEMRARETDD